MGEAIAKALIRTEVCARLHVTARSEARVARLLGQSSKVSVCDAAALVESSSIVIVALRPDDARDLLPGLPFAPTHHVISVMAAIRCAELTKMTGPVASSCRMITLPSVAGGGQTIPVFPHSDAAQALFGESNKLFDTGSEERLLAFWAVTGLLSSTLTVGKAGADWLAGQGIDRRAGDAYAAALFNEVHALLGEGFQNGLDEVSTPGGLNATVRQNLEDKGFTEVLNANLDSLYERLTKD